jgi:hypothetical protein
MANNSAHARREFQRVILFVSALSLLVVTGSVKETSSLSQALEVRYKKFIPANTEVQAIRAYDPKTKKESKQSGIKIGRLGGKGGEDLAFIYKQGDRLQLRVVQNPNRKATILDQPLPGSFVWMQDNRTNGFQLANLDGQDGDEIATMTSDGASLGAYLNIFAVRNGRIEGLLTRRDGYSVGGYKFTLEPSRNGAYRITVHTDKEGVKIETYEWNGKKFEESKKR